MTRPSTLFTCLFGLVLFGCSGKPDAGRTLPAAVELGAPAPAYAGVTTRGIPFELEALRGKVVLLNVWATWCEPCREELPELQALSDRLSERGLQVVGVSVDAARDRALLDSMIAGAELRYPVVHDARNLISRIFKVIGYPTTFVIDRAGVVRWRRDGLIAPGDPELAEVLRRALAEPS